eukprot:GFUD01021438.1.p1 GENE.GFUD01021438.1~~GFUD01021438.1.p1  ORF type:complete len:790 (-),score=107.30 GFUD01021438.1:132-2342(-)
MAEKTVLRVNIHEPGDISEEIQNTNSQKQKIVEVPSEGFEPDSGIKEDVYSIDSLVSLERKHACDACAFTAKSFCTLKVHREMTHVQLRFHCEFCSWNTKERYPLKSHLKKEHGVNIENSDEHIIHECGICFFKGSKEDFESHIQTLHSNFKDILMIGGQRMRSKQKICEYCGTDSRKFAAITLRKHIEFAHMKNKYKCVQCEFVSGWKQAVYDHIGEKHLLLNIDSRETRHFKRTNTKYKCKICSLLTESHYAMLEHMKGKHESDLKLRRIQRRRMEKDNDNQRMHKCPHCDYKTDVFCNLKVHIGIHIDSVFSCNVCGVKKKRRNQVVYHMKREHLMELKFNYKEWCQRYVTCFCRDCNFRGSSKDYDEHVEETHELPKVSKKLRKSKSVKELNQNFIYQCGKCDKRYTTRLSLKQHIAIKHLETVYRCDICDKTSRKVMEIKEHMTSVHPSQSEMVSTYCGECQTESPNDLNYKHIMKVHRALYTRVFEKGAEDKSKKLPRNAFQPTKYFLALNISGRCHFCDSSLKESETDYHMLKFHMKVSYICKKCGDEESTRSSMYAHIKKTHVAKGVSFKVTLEECLLLSCGWCDFKSGYQELVKHTQNHEKEILETKHSQQMCNFCDYKHISRIRLESHVARVHDIKPFSCDVCEFKSKTKQGLTDHYKTFHPDYKYKCKLCKFESSHLLALGRHHQAIHEQTKYHKCQKCFARFKRNDALQVHLKTVHEFESTNMV